MPDYRPRKPGTGFNIFTNGEMVAVNPASTAERSMAGQYMNDVKKYAHGKISHVVFQFKYNGQAVAGRELDTDPNLINEILEKEDAVYFYEEAEM